MIEGFGIDRDLGFSASVTDPVGDSSRQAVSALRGFAYQIYASALAWLSLGEGELLHLEVAEDYAVVAKNSLAGVQVRDTAGSGAITIRNDGVIQTIDSLVDLTLRNPGRRVTIRYLTTSPIGRERAHSDRVGDASALDHWRRAAGGADVAPLRSLLLALPLRPETKAFIEARDDGRLREELLARIHWDAGQPPLEGLAADLEDGLVEFASARLRLAGDVGRRMVADVLATVLKTSVQTDRRQLRMADLIRLGEQVGRVSLPLGSVEQLMQLLGGGERPSTRPTLLMRGELEIGPGPYAPRDELHATIDRALAAGRLAFVHGGTGLGKTRAAAVAAARRGPEWYSADFRYLPPDGTAQRLMALSAELAASPANIVLLDDLNGLDLPEVAAGLSRVLRVLGRRDGLVLATSSSPPSRRTMMTLAGKTDAAVAVPYLELDEIRDLVVEAGGDEKWAGVVYSASARGHPQLVQAALLHLRADAWSRRSLATLSMGRSEDLEAERRTARERLVAALPEGARTLLLRASMSPGRFPEQMALVLADVAPAIPSPGIELGRLVGPWIERAGRDRLRVSPLVAQAGEEVLSPAERTSVHRQAADYLLRRESISVEEGDIVLHHALAGGDRAQIAGYAHSLLTASVETLGLLARFSPMIAELPTEQPLVEGDPATAATLRLGQLLVVLAGSDKDRSRRVWAAMRREMRLQGGEISFEVVLLSKVLIQSTVSTVLHEWLDLVLRFDQLCMTSPALQSMAVAANEGRRLPGTMQGFIFIMQALGLERVSALRAALERLDGVGPDVRSRLFSVLAEGGGDFGHLVNAAWLKEVKRSDFDAHGAAADYLAMAELAEHWGNPRLAIRCQIARVMLLDEYAGDRAGASEVLGETERRYGPDPSILRTKAKLQWRSKDHLAALNLFEESWRDIGLDSDPTSRMVERGFVAREAAIVAAEIERWGESRTWFERARSALDDAPGPDMGAMRAGLVADGGHAAFMAGDRLGAVRAYDRALIELGDVDPDGTLREAHCHRLVRHAIAWMMQQVRPNDISAEERLTVPAGACSNPEPNELIRSHPLGDIDLIRYVLADIAVDLGDPSYQHDLYAQLKRGPILTMEATGPKRLADYHVEQGDGAAVAQLLIPYGSASAYLKREGEALFTGTMAEPKRGTIPQLPLDGSEPPEVLRAAVNLMLAFAATRAMDGHPDDIRRLRNGISGPEFASVSGLARRLVGSEGTDRTFEEMLASSVAEIAAAGGAPIDPGTAFTATARLLVFLGRTDFRKPIERRLVPWVRATWTTIVREHRFRLLDPQLHAAAIDRALASEAEPLAYTAAIVLAAEPAVRRQLPNDLRAALRAVTVGAS